MTYKKTHRLSRMLAVVFAFALAILSLYGVWKGICMARCYRVAPLSQERLEQLDLSKASHLMIVAHPDDETLWGGGHLQDGGYLVVCLTGGNNRTRAAEFQAVMADSGNQGLILSYPDKVAIVRDKWNRVEEQMRADLVLVLKAKDWTDVVTHNGGGEYGHIHHKMTHCFVVDAYDALGLTAPLYQFGTYYSKKRLPDVQDDLTPISDRALAGKESLLRHYSSQDLTVDKLSHMNPYEMWEQIRGGATDAAIDDTEKTA